MCNTFSFCVVCMYIPMSVTLGPWGVPSDVIRKHRARVAWLHGLCLHVTRLHGLRGCSMVTWLAPVHVSRGYMVCAMDSDRRKELARLRQRRHTYHMSVPRSCENECCAIPRVAGSTSFNAVAFLVI